MDIVIIGAGTTAQLMVSILENDRNFKVVGCVDIEWPDEQRKVLDIPVVGDHSVLDSLFSKGVGGAAVAVADNRIREQHFYAAQHIGYEMINAVHPSAVIGEDVTLGHGICIAEGCIVSTGVRVADNVILEAGAVIGSHVDIGPNVYVGNGTTIGNGATIGRNCFLDVGVSIARAVTVGKHNRVPPGTSVRESLSDQIAADEVE